ncbi:MAG: hypothetical protein IPL26_15485 [Leptospiraceae bacterium]|nr:hypothetical protein [Leptospiraceae bacterium]
MNFNYYKTSPIHIFESYPNFTLSIKREDKSFAGFGLKLKKIQGLIQFLKKGQIKDILLYGNPNSNFMATYTTMFHLENFQVHSLFYTNDPKLTTGNSILTKRFSDTSIFLKSKSNREFYIHEFKKGFPNGFVIPEFGIHETSLSSLNFLWREIENADTFDYLFLDIGTGFTALSALEYFKEKKIQIIGVTIGNKLNKIQYDLEQNSQKLGLDKNNFSNLKILEPSTSPAFASKNKQLEDWIRKIWINKNIPLEPVYSGKTLLTIHEYIPKANLKGKGLYLHQGGLLNHLKYYL